MSELADELRRFAHAERNLPLLESAKAKPRETDLSRLLDVAADRVERMEDQVVEFYQLCAALRKVEHYRTNAPRWSAFEEDET